MTTDETIRALAAPGDRRAASRRPSLREMLLKRWLTRLEAGRLTVDFPSGARQTFGGARRGTEARLSVDDLHVVTRVALSGDLGFAEGYMAGEWRTPDLTAVLTLFTENADAISRAAERTWGVTLINRLRHARRANTRTGSRRNIAAHYDLGNDFYRLWLDDTMSYSSALFERPGEPHERAQHRKYLRLAQALDLKPGERVLEIGCGWGAFAEIAAKAFGCHVTAVTLSPAQAAHARARIARAGLADRVEVRLEDYRDIRGRYDKIASIEMFEAVGEENWPVYFDALRERLVPGGRAGLQVISIADDIFADYRRNPDFIQRYIFPGGMLPSPTAFETAARQGGLTVAEVFTFSRSYAESLRRWRASFEAHWPEIEALGFDTRFRRMWRYYLAYCETGFDLGAIDVGHYLLARP